MNNNPLLELEEYGQAIWLDFISREIIDNNKLKRLIDEDHLKGVTSNPSIFQKAIAHSVDYDDEIAQLKNKHQNDAYKIYEDLVIKDIKDAADLLRPTYEENNHQDGFVSLEVSPHLAQDSEGTTREAIHLYERVNRPNVMIKVPGTLEGMNAISTLIAEGINVNVTLLFSVELYEKAALAYIEGLKKRLEKKKPIHHIQSVASFFVSRIDSKVDTLLNDIIAHSHDEQKIKLAKGLLGKIAIANAKQAYLKYLDIFESEEVNNLLKRGANIQRLLWASTSTKNPHYRDVMYVEELIGKNTINTLPPKTLEAFRDHGMVKPTLKKDIDNAKKTLDKLESVEINFDAVCNELLDEGIKLFKDPFDSLLKAILDKCARL